MSYALWLNGVKIHSAKAIPLHFDLNALKGYLNGGCLIPWLYENDGKHYADMLVAANKDIGCDAILCSVFGVPLPITESEDKENDVSVIFPNGKGYSSFFSGFSSFPMSSMPVLSTSFHFSSFPSSMIGSFGSFRIHLGSYRDFPNSQAHLSSCPLNQFGYGIHNI